MRVFMLCEEREGKSARRARAGVLPGALEREVEQHQWKEMGKEQKRRRDGVMMKSWV